VFAGDWSLTDATIGGCSAATESTGSTVASRVALWEKRLRKRMPLKEKRVTKLTGIRLSQT